MKQRVIWTVVIALCAAYPIVKLTNAYADKIAINENGSHSKTKNKESYLSIFHCSTSGGVTRKIFIKTDHYLDSDMEIQIGDDVLKCSTAYKEFN
ncbi:hypothetical protein Q3R63_004477 [Salmonella enterica]|nr:hypothetical protein [Salmonella enterica]ELM1533941.1 hypothetical protein [Salmonella enterica]